METESKKQSEKKGREPGVQENQEVARTVSEDPMLRFLMKWRKPLIVLALVILAGWYLKSSANQAHEEAMASASDLFEQAQKDLEAWNAGRAKQAAAAKDKKEEVPAEKKAEGADTAGGKAAGDETVARIEGKLQALREQGGPYAEIGQGYQVLMNVEEGKLDAAAQVLSQVKLDEIKRADGGDRFFTELTALVSARSLLDDPARKAEGLEKLRTLAEQGVYVNTSAAMSVARLAQTPEEREQARKLLQGIKDKYPVQASVVDGELKKLQTAL